MSWNQTYLMADPKFVPTQAYVEKLVRFLKERGIVGTVIRGLAVLDNSVAWESGPNVEAATFGPAWEVKLLTSPDLMVYGDDSGVIAETRLVLIFKEAADARDEFVQEVSSLLGVPIIDGISHH